MQEEFHGILNEDKSRTFKLLYGWNNLNANVWLPSLCELVGTTGDPVDWNGCYYSAMQGLNTTTWYCVDSKGGSQFAYFQQYNASGGGQKLWETCNQEIIWLRSPDYGQNHSIMTYGNSNGIYSNQPATASCAVHPAVKHKKI